MMRWMAAIVPALMLAACGGDDGREVASGTMTDAEGKTTDYSVTQSGDGEESQVTIKTDEGSVQFGSGGENAKLPDGLTLYPGSTLTGGMNSAVEGKSATMANFEVKGKAADVIAHYRQQVEAQGMKIKGEVSSPGNIILTAQQDTPVKRSVQITAAESGGVVTGSVMAQSQ
jgi:hypothetical protein